MYASLCVCVVCKPSLVRTEIFLMQNELPPIVVILINLHISQKKTEIQNEIEPKITIFLTCFSSTPFPSEPA